MTGVTLVTPRGKGGREVSLPPFLVSIICFECTSLRRARLRHSVPEDIVGEIGFGFLIQQLVIIAFADEGQHLKVAARNFHAGFL